MRKVIRELDLVNIDKGTVCHEEVTAYQFTSKTSDGTDFSMYVYRRKDSNEWLVNDDMGANVLIILIGEKTRKEAIDKATQNVGRFTEQEMTEKVNVLKRRKKHLKEEGVA